MVVNEVVVILAVLLWDVLLEVVDDMAVFVSVVPPTTVAAVFVLVVVEALVVGVVEVVLDVLVIVVVICVVWPVWIPPGVVLVVVIFDVEDVDGGGAEGGVAPNGCTITIRTNRIAITAIVT